MKKWGDDLDHFDDIQRFAKLQDAHMHILDFRLSK